MQPGRVFDLLRSTRWGADRTEAELCGQIGSSVCYGAFCGGKQVAFARAHIDSRGTYHLCDVVVEREWRGRGIGTRLILALVEDRALCGRTGTLETENAHRLYEKAGFYRCGRARMLRRPKRDEIDKGERKRCLMTKAEQLAALLPEEADGALVTSEANRRYLTGFPSSAGMALVARKAAVFLTDSRYIEAARRTVRGMDCVEYRSGDTLRELVNSWGLRTLAVEDEGMTVAERRRWEGKLDGVTLLGGVLDRLLNGMRLVKTPEELAAIRRAQALTDAGFEAILPLIREGRTEREVMLDLEFSIRRAGAERVAFDFIVVSGENSSLPHGVPGDRVIRRGDFVTMDFGAVVDGWHSDMTRTVVVGSCSDEQREVYDIVLRAQQAALAVLCAGITGVQGDAAAREVIEAAGYGGYFGHGTGHGVGMEIHEEPRLSPSAGNAPLSAGSVVTVEPGIYLPGKFGVRIEDMVVLTADGCENLTHSPKTLTVV